MRRQRKDKEINFWPAYVDALINVVLNLLFLVGVFIIGLSRTQSFTFEAMDRCTFTSGIGAHFWLDVFSTSDHSVDCCDTPSGVDLHHFVHIFHRHIAINYRAVSLQH